MREQMTAEKKRKTGDNKRDKNEVWGGGKGLNIAHASPKRILIRGTNPSSKAVGKLLGSGRTRTADKERA